MIEWLILIWNKLIVWFKKNKEPEWYRLAKKELGIMEVPGPLNDKRILEYHTYTDLRADKDSTPWCSAFVCFCIEQAGHVSTSSPLARSWLQWGYPMKGPEVGCIVIFSRGTALWSGHVGFFIREDDKFIYVLGGNQGNAVSIRGYEKERLLGYRWPIAQ